MRPLEIVRDCPESIVCLQQAFNEAVITALITVQPEKASETAAGYNVIVFKTGFKQFTDRLKFQHGALYFVGYREIRLHVYLVEELFYDTQSEAVDGRYVSPVKP